MYIQEQQEHSIELLKNAHVITDLTETEKHEKKRLEDAEHLAFELRCEEEETEIFNDTMQFSKMQSRIANRFGVHPDQVEIKSLYENPENVMHYNFSGLIAIHQIPDYVALEQAVIQSQIQEMSIRRAYVIDDDENLCDENDERYTIYDRVTDPKKYTRELVEVVDTLNDPCGYRGFEYNGIYLSFLDGKLESILFGDVLFQNNLAPCIYPIAWEPEEILDYANERNQLEDPDDSYYYLDDNYNLLSLNNMLDIGELGCSFEFLMDGSDDYDELSRRLLRLYKQTVLPRVRLGFDYILRNMEEGDRPVFVPYCPPPPLFTVPTREEFEKAVYRERLQKAYEQQVKNAERLAQNYENLIRNERPWAK
ncbi:hypothetical protein [Acidithiobacillus sulfurivorans]|uniref:Uncharacterized protein n=1 Tax=Acidithiobacillus sulfurivorans TaxID=1958756 RepID=A0ABS6A0B8_9PROT|nr:hypothetical protein [Acidithiobacillus sulfurivorans]MBU2760931.1 hypothetical protein [Acidithiobacillus sulfurivorans]